MNINPIRLEKDYRAALKRIDELIALDPKEGTEALNGKRELSKKIIKALPNELGIPYEILMV